MATQNPIEQEGTYPLPEAQLDRFLMHVCIDYPDIDAERDILQLARKEAREDIDASPDQPTEKINQRGVMTVWQRIDYLVDAGTWHPLHSTYNPLENAEGTTNVVDGLAKIEGRWAVVIGFDNKTSAVSHEYGLKANPLRP